MSDGAESFSEKVAETTRTFLGSVWNFFFQAAPPCLRFLDSIFSHLGYTFTKFKIETNDERTKRCFQDLRWIHPAGKSFEESDLPTREQEVFSDASLIKQHCGKQKNHQNSPQHHSRCFLFCYEWGLKAFALMLLSGQKLAEAFPHLRFYIASSYPTSCIPNLLT